MSAQIIPFLEFPQVDRSKEREYLRKMRECGNTLSDAVLLDIYRLIIKRMRERSSGTTR